MRNDVYITSTLQNNWNKQFNLKLCAALEKRGIRVYLPQRDTDQLASSEEKFSQNYRAIKEARKLMAIAVNESPNWGVEVGFAHGIGKKVIAVATRDNPVPLMALHMINHLVTVKDLEDFETYIDDLLEKITPDKVRSRQGQ